jgi:hypothetical protein
MGTSACFFHFLFPLEDVEGQQAILAQWHLGITQDLIIKRWWDRRTHPAPGGSFTGG